MKEDKSNEHYVEMDADFGKIPRRIFIGFCVVGSICGIYARILIGQQKSYSFQGCETTLFQYPWFTVLVMGLGMALALIIAKIYLLFSSTSYMDFSKLPLQVYLLTIIPSLCDLFYSVLYSFSIFNITGSLTVSLRFFEAVFTIVLQKVWLKKQHMPYKWLALATLLVGSLIVAVAVTLEGDAKLDASFWISVFLQVVAQVVVAVKDIFEEMLLHNYDIAPPMLCGLEGSYDVMIVLFIIYPIVYVIPKNNLVDLKEDLCAGFSMLMHNYKLLGLCVGYMFVACIYNISLMGTIMYTNAVIFSMTEMTISCGSWLIDLIIWHGLKGNLFGLSNELVGSMWTNWGYLRIFGSLCVFLGFALYSKVIRLPCFKYEESDVKIINLNLVDESYPSV